MVHTQLFPPGKMTISGELSERLSLNFNRLEQEDYRPKVESSAEITQAWKKNDEVWLSFPISLRTQPTMNLHSLPGHFTYRHGPLVLGTHVSGAFRCRHGLRMTQPGRYQAEGPDGIELYPLTDSYKHPEYVGRIDRKKVLFREVISSP